jgi:hypothetical protein
MDPITVLAMLGPLAVDLGKSLIGRFINGDGFKPASIADWLAMRQSDVDLFKAMNEAGGGSGGYPWVDAVVRLQRPFVAAVALGVWGWQETTLPGGATAAAANFAAAVGFYLFGDRTLFYARKAVGK